MSKLLIIEDEAHIREEVMDWFLFEGYQVAGAANGKLGLEAAYAEPPDLILCDILMPEMDGHEVLINVRSSAQLSQVPFIFLTAAADRDSVRKGMTLGADDYLTKPFTRTEVLNAVYSRLGKKANQDAQIQVQLKLMNELLLEEREKHLLKSRLVAIFSHDFRNPLSSILSSSNIIRNYEQRLTPERKQHHLDRIDGSVQQLMQMLDDMLMVAAVESGHLRYNPREIDVNTLIESILEDFRLIDQDDHKLTLRSSLYRRVNADDNLLRHIVTNLISNAIKYSDSESEIEITLEEDDAGFQLKVEDHGMGIPEESLSQLFQAFFRAPNARDIKGTGLGLNIVKECVICHQGEINVKSQVGKGSCFVVRLPETCS